MPVNLDGSFIHELPSSGPIWLGHRHRACRFHEPKAGRQRCLHTATHIASWNLSLSAPFRRASLSPSILRLTLGTQTWRLQADEQGGRMWGQQMAAISFCRLQPNVQYLGGIIGLGRRLPFYDGKILLASPTSLPDVGTGGEKATGYDASF